MILDDAIKQIKDALIKSEIPPWKAEDEAKKLGVAVPENITVGAMARRAFVEEKCGHQFCHIKLPEHPYHTAYRCPEDGTLWTLAADDSYVRCGLCATPLEVLPENERHQPLVNNYIGGVEDYYSYAGEVSVCGDVEKTFQNILCWGPGVGHLGISVGCYKINLEDLSAPGVQLRFGHLGDNFGKILFNQCLGFISLVLGIKYKCQVSGGTAPVRHFHLDGPVPVDFIAPHTDSQMAYTRAPA